MWAGVSWFSIGRVMCADMEDPSHYTGYQVAVWREIAADLGWADSDWTFSCVDWTAMIDDLVDPNGSCSFAAAAVEVSLTNILLGLKFSWPIYKSGFHVLIASAVEQGGTWAFAEAFHWSVWVALGATAITVALFITLVESITYGNRANRKGLRGWSWYSMGKMVQVPTHVGDPKTWASKTLVLGYAFLALIMVHLFTATTASKMTMQQLANDIKSRADLPGKKVISWEPYLPLLRKYSIDADAVPWDNDADTAAMLEALRSHKYQALVLDSPVVQYFAAQAEQCDLFPVGDPFETFSLAVAFPPDVPTGLPQNITSSIVRLQTYRGLLDELENVYMKGAATDSHSHADGSGGHQTCANTGFGSESGGHGSGSQIHMDQVMGLWIIMGITLATSLILVGFSQLQYRLFRRFNGVSPAGQQGAAAAALDPHSGHEDEPASGMLAMELPAALQKKAAAGDRFGGLANIEEAAAGSAGGIAAYRTDADAQVAVAGKHVAFGGAPPAAVSPRTSSMHQQQRGQQQQQVPWLAAQLFGPSCGDGAAVLTARQVALEDVEPVAAQQRGMQPHGIQPHGMQQRALQEEEEDADSVLML
ncbi:hypothetical protein OEZ86_010495 [Tetradesmus obliquus]|nr:hypothetical protein OEZ86_010495 [Tetradesmus obliquus]